MKKLHYFIIIFILLNGFVFSQNVGIGTTTPNASAQLDVSSTTKGLLAPRMTFAQRNAIVSPAPGLLVYQTDLVAGFYYYKDQAGGWQQITTGTIPSSLWNTFGATNNIYNSNLSGNVGIGMIPVSYKLSVDGDLFVKGTPSTIRVFGETAATSGKIFFEMPNNVQDYAITHVNDFLIFSRQFTNGNIFPDLIINQEGNIGMGSFDAAVKLHITAGTDVGNASGGFLQLGTSNGLNIGFDNNEIQARNNGVVSRLVLQNGGGPVQIGSGNPATGYLLSVNGKMISEEVRVALYGTADWPDYVFERNYKLPSIKQLEDFIILNKHLPNLPAAEQVKKEGFDLGDMNRRLLEKIEELTLYIIQQDKKLGALQKQVNAIKTNR
jgi:hypothetical protein